MPRNNLFSSFRDPSGYVLQEGNQVYRVVRPSYAADYTKLMKSGLYDSLADQALIVSHKEVEKDEQQGASMLLQPEMLPFISYPYEWCFTQLKDAALCTLKVQQIALAHKMVLKDASSYNIQFSDGRPLLIDTLSFETYHEGDPWVAYKQFCQHFLAPLSLMYYTDFRLASMMRNYIDGIPLDLASRLLPYKSFLRLPLLLHIHLHAKSQQRHANKKISKRANFSFASLMGMIENLETLIRSMSCRKVFTEWGDYYDNTNYSTKAFHDKIEIIKQFLALAQVKGAVWDLGGNNGVFCRLASSQGIYTVCFDYDYNAVEQNYFQIKTMSEKNVLPLVLDMTNPSPAIGWANKERMSLSQRGPAELVMALALIHHLALANNLPFSLIFEYLVELTQKWVIVEFIPKTDSNVKRLLQNRKDIFESYNQEAFESQLRKHFRVVSARNISDSQRILYLLKKDR